MTGYDGAYDVVAKEIIRLPRYGVHGDSSEIQAPGQPYDYDRLSLAKSPSTGTSAPTEKMSGLPNILHGRT
jgi:hypothetical protein